LSKYALVPDGFTLKKVSKAEEEAIKDHRRHEDVKTFLNNETTPLLVGGVALAAVTPILVNLILEFVEKQVPVTEQQKTAIKAGIVGGALPALLYQQLTKVDLNEIWQKVVVI
jgi:hypothetical protein